MNTFWKRLDQLDALAGRSILWIWKSLLLVGIQTLLAVTTATASFAWRGNVLIWKKLRSHWKTLVEAKIFFAFIVILFLLWRWLAEKATSAVTLPSSFWWWVLGIAVATIVSVIVWKNRKSVTALGYVKKIRFKWVFWPALIGVIVLVNFYKHEAEEGLNDYLHDKDIGGLPILARSESVSDEATLAMISECESRGRHRDDNNNVVTNENSDGTTDVGLFQINSRHEAEAKKLNINLYTEEGNRRFAELLYAREGTVPWNSSRHCWGDKVVASYAKTFSGATIATRTVRVGRSWSNWVGVPPGQEIFFERMENISFEVELQNGETFEFPRDFRGHKRFLLIQAVRFRVTDKEAEKLPVWVRFSPL